MGPLRWSLYVEYGQKAHYKKNFLGAASEPLWSGVLSLWYATGLENNSFSNCSGPISYTRGSKHVVHEAFQVIGEMFSKHLTKHLPSEISLFLYFLKLWIHYLYHILHAIVPCSNNGQKLIVKARWYVGNPLKRKSRGCFYPKKMFFHSLKQVEMWNLQSSACLHP